MKWLLVLLAGVLFIAVSPSEGLLRVKRRNTEARVIDKLYSRESLPDLTSRDFKKLIKASSNSIQHELVTFQQSLRHKRSDENCGMSQELTHESVREWL